MINFLKEFFGFTKKELNGLFILCFLILIIALAPLVYSFFKPVEKYDYSAFAKEVAAFRASAKAKPSYNYHENDFEKADDNKTRAPQLFSFNPNNLSVSLWEKLGLSTRQIKVIKNYEAKGGKFYRKEDLKKIYSIKQEQYTVLEPYINIPPKAYPAYSKTPYEKKPYAAKVSNIIDLNTADSVQLESLNGVGPAFASRIIKYRNRLGGFYSKAQLKEVYGLDSVLYDKLQNQITVNPSAIRPFLINSATFADLKGHPYLTYKQINAIIKFRNQHGAYKSLTDLKAIVVLDEKVLDKIGPYIRFE